MNSKCDVKNAKNLLAKIMLILSAKEVNTMSLTNEIVIN